jgi:hypothetical protein
MQNSAPSVRLQQIALSYDFHPFGDLLRPTILEALREAGKDRFRAGTILIPTFLVWFVLALTIRRDLNLQAVIDWMISAARWIDLNLAVSLLSEGALSHARVALGFEVFELIFKKLSARVELSPDFHSLVTVIFDGSTMTMPDTEKNRAEFGKPSSRAGEAGYPQLRMVALLVGATHVMLDLAFAACRGKGTGEQSLMMQILERTTRKGLLFLFDAGFYSFALAWMIQQRDEHFLMKVNRNLKLVPIKGSQLADGSYLARITGKVDGQKQEMTVRVIECHLRGFRPFRLITNLRDEAITARELVRHYHRRWEIEIAFDEIKTHQCARLRGQMPTIFRSKRPDLVKQELYALMITYTTLRLLMQRAAAQAGKKPVELSFLETLQAIIDAVPLLNWKEHPHSEAEMMAYLLTVIAEAEIECARRPRINPRVVKVKMSNFARKNKTHRGEVRDFDKELWIIAPSAPETEINSVLKQAA